MISLNWFIQRNRYTKSPNLPVAIYTALRFKKNVRSVESLMSRAKTRDVIGADHRWRLSAIIRLLPGPPRFYLPRRLPVIGRRVYVFWEQ